MNDRDAIERFLADGPWAVAGASQDRAKYGNKVLRCYLQHHRVVYPLHPRQATVEGLRAYPDLAALPATPHGVSLVTQPAVTRMIVEQAIDLGIGHLWMQPGAEDAAAVEAALGAGINLIHGGPCVLVAMGFKDE
jgi:predicted CoA-binding protein